MNRRSVFKWCREFRGGRKNDHDKQSSTSHFGWCCQCFGAEKTSFWWNVCFRERTSMWALKQLKRSIKNEGNSDERGVLVVRQRLSHQSALGLIGLGCFEPPPVFPWLVAFRLSSFRISEARNYIFNRRAGAEKRFWSGGRSFFGENLKELVPRLTTCMWKIVNIFFFKYTCLKNIKI